MIFAPNRGRSKTKLHFQHKFLLLLHVGSSRKVYFSRFVYALHCTAHRLLIQTIFARNRQYQNKHLLIQARNDSIYHYIFAHKIKLMKKN